MNSHKFHRAITLFLLIFCALLAACAAQQQQAPAEDADLLPKYGLAPRNAEQREADDKFIAGTVQEYHGDRKKASKETSERGWYLLRQGDSATAMKRFNQAWLLDVENGSALWGMAALRGQAGKFTESLQLFGEAEPLVGDDMDFMADYAKIIAFAGLQGKDEALVKNALTRFSFIYDQAPDHTMNLQNWAITLYFLGDYRAAWEKIGLAMATPGKAELNRAFIDKLQRKMPQP
jgi:tetratricopeptide (TPR) repeat protein